MSRYIKLMLVRNELRDIEYVEPYAGGASVALSLLYEGYAAHIHINDLNRCIHAFWLSVTQHTDEFCAMIADTPVTIDEWIRQRQIYSSGAESMLDLGFATFFLNRTNRSGIISGGVIGGLEQAGAWKIDARYPRDELIRRVRKVGRHRAQISVTGLDALELVASLRDSLPAQSLIYLDPPYYVKGHHLYDNFYSAEDHASVANALADLQTPWIVSYDAAPEILSLYSAYRTKEYTLSYSAAGSSQGQEYLFASEGLTFPEGRPQRARTDASNAYSAF
jgi:DNA adenine methylase